MLMGIRKRIRSKTIALFAALFSTILLVGCDITPKSPVLAGDTGESSNEAVGTILPDPPPKHPPSSNQHGKEKAPPEMDPLKSQEGQTPKKGEK